MTTNETAPPSNEAGWRGVDEGWGRRAVDFSTLSEPSNAREYVALHQHLDVRAGDRLLDIACGSGLAIALAAARGAVCSGLDASARLVAVAQDRSPDADIQLGDMHALPWPDDSFDVVTSFRGIWGTTPDAMQEVRRVLVAGGRVGLTVWGHIKVSPGAWALSPFRLASPAMVENQAAMVSLGRPGAGEELFDSWGFVDVERVSIPMVWEFADPETYARALASTGPAYEAIQTVGEEAFHAYAVEVAAERVRDGLPLRAPIDVVGYTARKPAERRTAATTSGLPEDESVASGFLPVVETTPAVQALYDDDVEELGFVMNVSRVWARDPKAKEDLFGLLGHTVRAGSLSFRQRGILVTATASTLGDSYCSLAWGKKLSGEAGADVAGSVLRGGDEPLDDAERALAAWARKVVRDPNGTRAEDVAELRAAGFDDDQIFAITVFVALRLAFSTVNDALGVQPDAELRDSVPGVVRSAVTFGRPIAADG